MISNENKLLAKMAMEFAMKNGCNAARVGIYTGTDSEIEYRNTQIDRLQQASENSMNIELFVDERYGSFSTNRLDKKGIEKLILEGIASVRFLDKDPFRKLPSPERYYKNENKSLHTFDSEYSKIQVDEKITLAQKPVKEILGSNPLIVSVTGNYSDNESFSYMIASNGFEGETANSRFSVSAEVALKGEDGVRPSSYWYDTSLFSDKLRVEGVGKKALERTLRKLGQEKIASGKFAMLLENMQVSRLLSPMVAAMNGGSLQQKNSFLLEKLDQKIISDKINIFDKPHLEGAIGARWFDGEGIATSERKIIEKGVLKTYFIDTYNGAKMKMEPTIQSPSILTFETGNRNHQQILENLEKGIWVTNFNGGNSNSTTGDFSFGIEGFLVENGKIIKAINEMNITGNLLDLWSKVLEVGNDPNLMSSWRTPAILFDEVNFSGS